ncbi:FK506-binding protein 15 isoform X2 [Xenopus laevis]|uniref:peptidylprolyl isomerase n=2 Tax=Xenopus laevis TaxID=8355 RepID=A0A1L8F5Q5_XENLA|nr:FK506-binding protein 15 isoform X2 [Xenopus laevis]OCT66913.1 hypothetical protein XELAEV_18038195mg [Xenopus laevis]
MFGADEEDTDFLSPTGGAKLASLFGMDQTVSGPGNESFQYTAPKQPKKGPGATGGKANKPTAPAGSGLAPAVLFATAVHAYRYNNGQYVKQGKFGSAVLGNHTAKEYRILLYMSQQQPVTVAKIHPGFMFTVQPNNYAAFYDDQRQSWSVMFESETAAIDFSKQVCMAKCNSSPSLDTVIYQDLLPGEGQGADIGDLLEVAYTGWLYQNHELGQVFDSNVQKDKLLRLKLGSGKVIKGWDEGMLGMKKGAKRFLVIPPALGYGSQGIAGRIPPNATLLFEVEIKRMKVKDQGSDRQSIGSRDSPVSIPDSQTAEMLPQPPSSIPPKPGEPAIRAKSNSISEQLANPDMAKAKLISRMAKMGQPMLPFIPGTPQPDSSDSEIEDPNTQRSVPHLAAPLPIRPTPQMNHMPAAHIPAPEPQTVPTIQGTSVALMSVGPIQSQALAPGMAPGFQPYVGVQYPYTHNPTTQLQSVAPVYPPQLQTPSPFQAGGDVTSFLMTEARQQSTEIRMSIGKIADKIDVLASKVDNLQKENSASTSHLLPGITSITMESAMIMNNIQRIIQENERLKHEVLEKSSRIEEQNVKIGELIHRNQKYMEQSNLLMEQRNDSLKTTAENTQTRMLNAMQEKVKLAEELAAATSQLSRLQLELTAYQKKETELRMQLEAAQQESEKHRSQLSSLQVHFLEVQETSEHSKTKAKSEKDTRRQLEGTLSTLEEEVSDLKAQKDNLEKSLAERKRRSQQERQRAEEEKEELRRSLQEEMEDLRQILKKTREQAAAEQVSSRSWEGQRLSELEEQAAQLHPLREKYAVLERQMAAMLEEQKKSKEKETSSASEQALALRLNEQKMAELQEQAAQLQPLKEKYEHLRSQMSALLKEQSKSQSQEAPATDTTEEVKKIMNGVFQGLRGEFDLEEMYSGREVLGTIMSIIKATTLQLLNQQQPEAASESSSEEEEKEDEDAQVESSVPMVAVASQNQAFQEKDPDLKDEWACQAAIEEASETLDEDEDKDAEEEQNEVRDFTTEPSSANQEGEEGPEQVQVIQENLEETSALVHMMCSDMHESSTVTPVQVNGKESEHSKGEDLGSDPKTIATEAQPVAHDLQDQIPSQEAIQTQDSSAPSLEADGDDLEDGKSEGPPPLGSDEEMGSPVPPLDPMSQSENTDRAQTEKERGLAESKLKTNIALEESDNEDLFENPPPKPQRSKPEEEEEEEVSMKGRPPPAPLFGDDDDDDFDWLG